MALYVTISYHSIKKPSNGDHFPDNPYEMSSQHDKKQKAKNNSKRLLQTERKEKLYQFREEKA